MTDTRKLVDLAALTPAECILLAEELWERAYNNLETAPVPESHLAELNRRVDALESGEMGPGESWDIVRQRLWRS